MSTFGHNGVIKNPTFEHSQDPAHIAAGKVLEENGVRTSEQVTDGGLKPRTRIPLWLKLIVFLMFLIAVIALVFTLLMYSGKIAPQTSNPTELLNSKASSPQSGFDISNKQLKQLIDELQQQVKDLEAKLNETKTMLENSIDETKKMSKTDNDALKAMLENSINKTKVMSKADDEALKALLENSINETKSRMGQPHLAITHMNQCQ
ncbi:hypothetical protein AC249_AIPGENE21003 [Exaiptasia diaphana]|nr:hypothetical protein AC249_AIPGENE21003 [Exaiptasia diaphana]